jgi:mono/diheme cytochrome c family protein
VLLGIGLLAISTEGKIGLGAIAGLFIVFALLASFWFPRRNPDFPGNRLGLFTLVTAVLFVATIAGVVVFAVEEEEGHGGEAAAETHAGETTGGETTGGETTGGETTGGETTGGETTGEEEEEGGASGDAAAGEQVYASAGCGACHTLEAAGSNGQVGPNLDESQPDAELVEDRVRNGAGAMPAFEDQLSDQQISDVTAFVVESTQG